MIILRQMDTYSDNKKNTAMKTIKGTYRDNNYFEYEVNGKKYLVFCL